MLNTIVPAAGEAIAKITRRVILGGMAAMAAPTVVLAHSEPKMTARERAEYHLLALRSALEDETGTPFHVEIAMLDLKKSRGAILGSLVIEYLCIATGLARLRIGVGCPSSY